MLALLREQLPDVLKAIAPLLATALVLQLTVVHAPAALMLEFFAGVALAVLGLLLLFTGIELGILPMGRFIGADLPRRRSLPLIIAVAFAFGAATTVAEPDVLVFSELAASASEDAFGARPLAYLVAAGVGLLTAVALSRVVYGYSMRILVAAVYALMLLLTPFAPAQFVSVAYDAGSVTTGVLTTPVLLSLALGLTAVLPGRSAVSDGFGLLGLASAGPIIAVLLLGVAQR